MSADPEGPYPCPVCQGSGQEWIMCRDDFNDGDYRTCTTCKGTGQRDRPLPACARCGEMPAMVSDEYDRCRGCKDAGWVLGNGSWAVRWA